jgi:hypothetical protein
MPVLLSISKVAQILKRTEVLSVYCVSGSRTEVS